MSRRPLLFIALSFCSGILAASLVNAGLVWVYLPALILLVLSFLAFRQQAVFDVLVLFLSLALGAAFFENSRLLPDNHIVEYIRGQDQGTCPIKGVVNSEPQVKHNNTSFVLSAKAMQLEEKAASVEGDILVNISGTKELGYLDEVVLSGNLKKPAGFFYKGADQYRRYLANRGIYALMKVKAPACVYKLPSGGRSFSLKRIAIRIKHIAEAIIFRNVRDLAAGILDAMVLGDKSHIPILIYNAMIKTGTVHILVVSGFNTGLVAFAIVLLLRLLRLNRISRFFLAAPLIILYCFITGASTPVIRATVMTITFMFSYLVKRQADIYNCLAFAALFILVISPGQLFDAGFQLSFGSVLSIACLYPRINGLFRDKTIFKTRISFIFQAVIVSLSAWLGTMGIIACYFRIFSPVTVLANLFIVPLASLITLCGFSLLLIDRILPWLSPFFARTSEALVAAMLIINNLLLKIPAASWKF